MSVVTSVKTVGSKKLPPPRGKLATEDHLGAFLDGSADVRLNLGWFELSSAEMTYMLYGCR
jgi:hypothetical protein